MALDSMPASQQQSFYGKDDYDKAVYENDFQNWVKIISMLILFYIFQGLHWWANFELGVHDSEMSTFYNLIIFGTAVLVIGLMLFFGAQVNRKKLTHEFFVEKISEETQRLLEEQAKKKHDAKAEAVDGITKA
uniref:Uncharacterized protein n=1 Tax=Strombidium inclinatum TaxID=197538 RepID=A0A7S3IJ23_9SPIT|mmetsp:Transcript_22302/g.34508  ORF Transcript_22302/g.34508 Transcript_22302/m.34508 type:complete len:133 (+) Transcript_22302:89-487(+)|eukprot:CAMPEP_0170492314 /NCGR_PEP_ID=MMETSP0208-20121228/12023_1 /TAXON_ID=197538 /ORGANISM="Strombidium inclinatum, Strain S3" /LENGTH=132 /DNA_ID=CAMNT_0010768031 /DNA_START=32 /DNA_END=430 /DNA_ORIENTATION=+